MVAIPAGAWHRHGTTNGNPSSYTGKEKGYSFVTQIPGACELCHHIYAPFLAVEPPTAIKIAAPFELHPTLTISFAKVGCMRHTDARGSPLV